jgi:hypothetical protein
LFSFLWWIFWIHLSFDFTEFPDIHLFLFSHLPSWALQPEPTFDLLILSLIDWIALYDVDSPDFRSAWSRPCSPCSSDLLQLTKIRSSWSCFVWAWLDSDFDLLSFEHTLTLSSFDLRPPSLLILALFVLFSDFCACLSILFFWLHMLNLSFRDLTAFFRASVSWTA